MRVDAVGDDVGGGETGGRRSGMAPYTCKHTKESTEYVHVILKVTDRKHF